ncbi:NADPH:quinone reductase-like Zn-dependent oxidoreductase [Algoriphagus ratkowskyi]|uniref:NADPH:quinone reductase-like Zn-dependent oxidoreductase n=1 Tax=Algoriphagus ratkowskyi TaxID=57028 RepID=A0A2W7R6I9_9BACT|nr:zinc-binding dehydrogenase [Algoriphagus ratkowskyi]PZX53950.1 NADPH:quinone reductase-like Zn-dependent oxidoreductase [Algoriphagus ratkowskyi]TXD76650.1 zinc-binding dehydrogenase [Algoriphagus ratkowskyi]
MKAITLDSSQDSKLLLTDVQSRALLPGEVRVQIKAAALNHRDEWCRKGLYPNLKDGVVLGSDGAGIVAEIGEGVDYDWLQKEVIINPALNWGANQKVQSEAFEILGMPRNGTLAESVIVPLDRLHEKPAHLSWEEAGALPLAGLTAFRALTFQGDLQAGENLLVTGFGGGVAQFAVQFGLALGARVSTSSSSPEKLERANALGVDFTFNYMDHNWISKAFEETNGFDLIVDGAVGDTLNHLIEVAKPGGKIVFYGATLGNPSKLIARKIFWNQLKIMGTTMGSDQDFINMLSLVCEKRIVPIIDQVFKFDEAEEAFDRMRDGKQTGKIVLVP